MDELDLGWQTIEGKKKILVVAAHNFRQGRDGKIKAADMGTGDLARMICERYGTFGLISTREQLDPNWYINSPFREKVKEIIKEKNIMLVIDVHGKNLGAEKLLELKGNNKFKEIYKIEVNNFIENKQETLAEEMDKSVPVLQIEIREDGRVKTVNEVKYIEAQNLINDLMNKLDES